ncbi:hypothetical protein Pst134EA_017765 [Puccinia striiformis f. sp. tritici]|uniref:Uncharacterized protein n=1 Tax=Puccinia striiformis f. sp. tritici PST-78 TaxID=1165861 RepID=A0A0L0VXN0_9BASI|nr:hypothetical protein Pst134EA_017765 [Puccinia striiformis f. sp. tritici]KAH9451168.1 hypothetical protein Pst134EB_018660 [Puccinia striiformis f. sp. tritici]KAH9461461.1 hypothetical protein Pst134EA_017765 [Puccinia striiformis f. sp. tritici]KNF03790.1 hypothetical protein PSTG_02886 [Puccinia striiformis f. sp. tritici PST-78]
MLAVLRPRGQPMLKSKVLQPKTTRMPKATTPGVREMIFPIQRPVSEDQSWITQLAFLTSARSYL